MKSDETVPKADHDAAVASARVEGEKAGAAAERKRIASIMDCDAAKERPVLARALALSTDMTANAASAFMADLPAETSDVASSPNFTLSDDGPGAGVAIH